MWYLVVRVSPLFSYFSFNITLWLLEIILRINHLNANFSETAFYIHLFSLKKKKKKDLVKFAFQTDV